jgi:hypothetical protein
MKPSKSSQLQIRVSAKEKAAIRRAARRSGQDMSQYVLSRVLPQLSEAFQSLVRRARLANPPGFALAELHTFLEGLTPAELSEGVAAAPDVALPPFLANYVAAMVETACLRKSERVPEWTRRIAPLSPPSDVATSSSIPRSARRCRFVSVLTEADMRRLFAQLNEELLPSNTIGELYLVGLGLDLGNTPAERVLREGVLQREPSAHWK